MPTVTLERTERFSIQASVSGRTYDIALAPPLPLITGNAPEDCAILFVLDSSLSFGATVERATLPSVMGLFQSAVIVGVGYPGDLVSSIQARTVDLTPETPADAHMEMQPMLGSAFGGADAFLTFLLDELAPEVRRRVPEASKSRVILNGFSLAGLFSAYALMKRPEDLESVAIMSPSLWWNDFSVLQELDAFKVRLEAAGAAPRVFVSVGALEQEDVLSVPEGLDLEAVRESVRKARMVDAAREFAGVLGGLLPHVEFALFAGEDHSGALIAGTGRAVGFALKTPVAAD